MTKTKPARVLKVRSVVETEAATILSLTVVTDAEATDYVVTCPTPTGELLRVRWERTGRGPSEAYAVELTPRGSAVRCACPARVKCRHRLATEALVQRGLIAADDF